MTPQWLRKALNNYQNACKLGALKAVIVNSDQTLALFDPALPTRLETDASRLHGLGYVLRQLDGDDWKLVQCGSRFLTDTESHYSTIEVEMLALVWATKKLHIYLYGLQEYQVLLDNTALVPILN